MRWSIRQQVLVPIVAIQTLSIAAITIVSMALAARRTERQIVERLSGVVDALGGSNFPLTDGILARMHSLSAPVSLRMVPRANRSRPVIRAWPRAPCVTGHSGPQPGSLRQPQRLADARGQRSEPFRRAHRPALIDLGDGFTGALSRVKLARRTVGVGPGPFDTWGRGAGAHGGRDHMDRPPHQWANSPPGAPGGPDRRGRLPRASRWTRSRHATRSTTWPGRSTGCAPSFGRCVRRSASRSAPTCWRSLRRGWLISSGTR